MKNWAGNYEYIASQIIAPSSIEELQIIIRQADFVRALGSRHSFNEVADTNGVLVSMDNLRRVIEINSKKSQVTVEGGCRYGDLVKEIHEAGFGLPNLASLPHISIAGAIATATHGAGRWVPQLGTTIEEIEFVGTDGELRKVNKALDTNKLNGNIVHLGCLGIISKLKINLVPTYDISQRVYLDLPFSEAFENLEEIMSGGYSVSLFTTWRNLKFEQVWVKDLADNRLPSAVCSAKPATDNKHPIGENSPEACTPQLGLPGPWFERLPHFRLGFTPSSGEELQSEYWIPFDAAVPALQALESLQAEITPLLHISEVRSVGKDTCWLSPGQNQNCLTIHFTWRKNWFEVQKVLSKIEKILGEYQARPHWGKLFTTPMEGIANLYPMLPEFRDQVIRNDPNGKFRNQFIDRLFQY